MEPEEPYIPYEERTPKELCRDIMFKAEKLYLNNEKKALLIGAVVFLVFVALAWRKLRSFDDYYWLVGIGAIGVVYFVFYFINHKLINDMYNTANPRHFLSMVQRLKKCLKIRNYIFIATAAWTTFLQSWDLWGLNIWLWAAVSIIPSLLIAWIGISVNPVSKSDSGFCEDIDELELRLNE